ncbi:MAG: hypothetical protein ACLU9N_00925, partial [Clostridia bacterium]
QKLLNFVGLKTAQILTTPTPQKETLRKLFVLFRKNEAKFKNAFGTAFCPNRCPKKSPKSPCYLR